MAPGGVTMAGRRPKPTALKELAGNPGKRALNRAAEDAAQGATAAAQAGGASVQGQTARPPTCPAWLQGEARKEYRRAGKILAQMRVLHESDRTALAAYAQQYAQWIEAQEQVRLTGVIVQSPNGFPIQNPYLSVANQALKQMRALLVELGMTPAARSRVHPVEKETGDPFEDFLRQRDGQQRNG